MVVEKIVATAWADQVQAWGTVAGVAVVVAGFIAIFLTVRETRKQQRTQAGPYVRVHLGVAGISVGDFEPPKVHYTNTSNIVDLDGATPDDEKVIISAWLRNYQAHPLGFALGVTLKIFAEAYLTSDGYSRSDLEAQVAYLEHGKSVRIDLRQAKMPTNQEDSIVVYVEQLAYYDFYDQLNLHVFAEEGTNALHGRLSCVVTVDGVSSLPEAWRRGSRVTYDR